MTSTNLANGEPPTSRLRLRRRLIALTLGICLAGCAAWLVYWNFSLRHSESTDDAYAAGNLVRISPQVPGMVKEILADNTQKVRAGQILVRLDERDALLALDRARVVLAEAVRQSESLMMETRRLEAVVEQNSIALEKAEGDLARRKNYKKGISISEEELIHARDSVRISRAALSIARLALRGNKALVKDSPLEEQPVVLAAANRLRQAWFDYKRCEVRSPVDGYVARRAAQPGMYAQPGAPLMAVVPLDSLWVDANFKEVQLREMRVGQKAVVHADIYGKAVAYEGTVAGFAPGTGSSFSLLPPENATGNWIKIIQRVPVKIVLDKAALEAAPLLVGLSCRVSVDIGDQSGPMLRQEENGEPLLRAEGQDYDRAEIDAEISSIIKIHKQDGL